MSSPPSTLNQMCSIVSSSPSAISVSNPVDNTVDFNNATSSVSSYNANNFDIATSSTLINSSRNQNELPFDFEDLEDFRDFDNFEDLNDCKETDNDFDSFFQEVLPSLVAESFASSTPSELQSKISQPLASTEQSQLTTSPSTESTSPNEEHPFLLQSPQSFPTYQLQSMDLQLLTPSSTEQVSTVLSQLVASTTSTLFQMVLQSMKSTLTGEFQKIISQSVTSSTSSPSLFQPMDSQLQVPLPADPLPSMESKSNTSTLLDKEERIVSETITSTSTMEMSEETQKISQTSDSFQVDQLMVSELVTTTTPDETPTMPFLSSDLVEVNSKTQKKATSKGLTEKVKDYSQRQKPYAVPASGSTKITRQSINEKLDVLKSFGFVDSETNLKILKKNKFDLDESINNLLDMQTKSSSKIRNENKVNVIKNMKQGSVQAIKSHSLASSSSDQTMVPQMTRRRKTQTSQPTIEEPVTITELQHTPTIPHSLPPSNSSEVKSKAENETSLKLTENNAVVRVGPQRHEPYSVTAAPIIRRKCVNGKLAVLASCGFKNADENLKILKKNEYNLILTANELLDLHDKSKHNLRYKKKMNVDLVMNLNEISLPNENCPICCNDYDNTNTNWTTLDCSHKFCTGCRKQMEKTRTTMSGTSQKFVKCPLCKGITGIAIGTCPNGTMKEAIIPFACKGYESYNSIVISYSVKNSKFEFERNAYLPYNSEGKEILDLLRIAWDRRICFKIRTSTTGQEHVLDWNIEHKTSRSGGTLGYPDITYLQRVKLDLMVFGICKKD